MTNEQAFTMIEHAIVHLKQSDAYWDNEEYLPTERAINTLYEAHKAIGVLGQIPSWETEQRTVSYWYRGSAHINPTKGNGKAEVSK
jgi:hypothetical protein